ncbi:MAG: hypothetical protein KatS3mg127_0184 [Silanimonas sp.]|nr:MAG: hypothetical protein KatS3mg127_0184 [Silanimonas sp.]
MPPISRRQFLHLASVTAAALALPCAGAAPSTIAVDRRLFAQSVASGDPRPDRVVLWTRIAPGSGIASLRLQLATDEAFEDLRVDRYFSVGAATDGCLKVRVEGLEPDRRYHYRFLATTPQGMVSSPVGRTRTAPAPGAERDLRFAFLSCQDYTGRWYNSLLPLLEEELDFILHLGDFIYETVGDPGFQEGEGRRIVFDDAAGAIELGKAGRRFYAASSLDNYRQLHREYRSDPVLQALLERAPLVAIWDDHEFSDDCWQDVATFHDGRVDERDGERRRNAEQAWHEYLPADLDLARDGRAVDRGALFPQGQIWRELVFGKRLALMATDFRSARPDHLVPEDAFPGALVYDEPALREALPRIGETFEDWHGHLHPYIDLREPAYRRQRAAIRRALIRAYRDEGLAAAEVRRRVARAIAAPMALPVANAILQRHDAAAPFFLKAGPIEARPDLPRGLSWAALGKSRLFDAVGSRYFVIAPTYRLLARLRAAETPSALGEAQARWLQGALERHAGADWRIVASSVSFTPLQLDLRRPELASPPAWAHEVLLNVDHWDAFPVERAAWFEAFDRHGALLLSGDIHAGFASQHAARVVEFTTPAVSSTTLGSILGRNVDGDAATRAAGRRLVEALDALLIAGYPGLRYAQTRRHGVSLVMLGSEAMEVRFLEFDERLAGECLYERPGAWREQVQERRFRVERGEAGWSLQEVAPPR